MGAEAKGGVVSENPIDDVIKRAQNPGPALEGPVADVLRGAIREQFDSQGARLGTPWVPRAVARMLGGRSITELLGGPAGSLAHSLTERGAPHGSQELRDGGKTLEIGTDHPGAFAQTGTSRGEAARPIVPEELPDELLEEIADRIGDYILEGLL